VTKEFSTCVIVNDAADQVLLILRDDFRIWALPGGTREPGETPEQTALRECLEETGYQVAIDGYVGRYERPQLKDTRHVYRVHITGGQAIQNGPETVEVRWFPVRQLPKKMTPFVAAIVQDTLAHRGDPFQKAQYLPAWQIALFKIRLGLRNLSNRLKGGR